MPRKHLLIGGLLLTVFMLSCNFIAATETADPQVTVITEPTSSSPNNILQSEGQVRRIPIEQALAALQSGAVVIVDVRSTQAYDASHVQGAISIPLFDIESNIDALPLEKDQWIITYCT
jgi:hypothetical protein